jgi:hypothetical protein
MTDTYSVCWNPEQKPPVYFIDTKGAKNDGDITVKAPTTFVFNANEGCSAVAVYPFIIRVTPTATDFKVSYNGTTYVAVDDEYQKVNETIYLNMTLQYQDKPIYVIEGRKPVIRNATHFPLDPSYLLPSIVGLAVILAFIYFWRR